MKTINDLLDAIKQRRKLGTDSALAAALGVKRQTVNNWRQGRNTPDAVTCATIAGLSGEPLTLVIGIAGEQRAVSAEEKKVWRRLAATAMTVLLVCGISGKSHAGRIDSESLFQIWQPQAMHYAKLSNATAYICRRA
jgi:transcriptional regulator with XRE-family HTH domain